MNTNKNKFDINYDEYFDVNYEDWNRTSLSWKQLKPYRNFNCRLETYETIPEFCERINGIISIPEPVADQWLWKHYDKPETVNNYGWINYENATCTLSTITTDQAIKLKVINKYEECVRLKESVGPFGKDTGIDKKDKNYWINEYTWRVPPVIVDVNSFPSPPCYADFLGHYQLIEGHTRLGYLLAMNRTGKKLREKHQVYILRNK